MSNLTHTKNTDIDKTVVSVKGSVYTSEAGEQAKAAKRIKGNR